MKKNVFKVIVLLFLGIIFTSCSEPQVQTVDEMLDDKNKQEEIMTAITSDNEMTATMMDHMKKNESATQMMMDDQMMMDKMIDKAFNMADQDSVYCMNLYNKMMNYPNMMKGVKMMMMEQEKMMMDKKKMMK